MKMRCYLKRFMMVASSNVFVDVLLFLDLRQRRGPCASANHAGQPAEPAEHQSESTALQLITRPLHTGQGGFRTDCGALKRTSDEFRHG